MEDPDKLLIETTCGDHEATVADFELGTLECDEGVAAVNEEFSATAYCCEGVEPPRSCNVCEGIEDGELMNADAVLPDTPGTTCREVADLAEFITLESTCSRVQDRSSLICCTENVCRLCPVDLKKGMTGEVTSPEKELPRFVQESVMTCGDLDVFITEIDENCASTLEDLNENIDFTRWCGCAGLEDEPSTCDLCGSLPLLDGETETPSGATCEYMNEEAPFVVDETTCDAIKENRDLCCDFSDPVCDLCSNGNGRDYDHPDKKTLMDEDVYEQTCEDMDKDVFQMGYVTKDSCADFRSDLSRDFDTRGYCGCSDDGPPFNPPCPLCDTDTENVKENVDVNEFDMTCKELYDYALYVKDSESELCSKNVEEYHNLCCENKPPTPAPQPTPTTMPPVNPPIASGAVDQKVVTFLAMTLPAFAAWL